MGKMEQTTAIRFIPLILLNLWVHAVLQTHQLCQISLYFRKANQKKMFCGNFWWPRAIILMFSLEFQKSECKITCFDNVGLFHFDELWSNFVKTAKSQPTMKYWVVFVPYILINSSFKVRISILLKSLNDTNWNDQIKGKHFYLSKMKHLWC